MNIQSKPCHKSNYGNKRNTKDIKYIVIHYTANSNDTAINNCKFFQTVGRNSSAHYFVDETAIYQSVQDDYVAWSVGGNKYPNCSVSGGGTYYNKCINDNSISVELCNSVNTVPLKTRNNVIELVVTLMRKYNIGLNNVIRHFDVTGKNCPASLINSTEWNKFKQQVEKAYKGSEYKVTTTKIILNGVEKTVSVININDTNYVKLRDLEDSKIKVTYNTTKKMPMVTSK